MPKNKPTIKSIIVNGIKEGWTANRILKAVAAKHPNSQANLTHVKYYSGHLKRNGEITQDQHDKYLSKPRKGEAVKKDPAKKVAAKVPKKVPAKVEKVLAKVEKTPAKKVPKKVPKLVKKPKAA